VLASYFLDAFTVIGYLWPNGERGSGKTQLLAVVAGLGFLGQVILAGCSYAALRDLSDYGSLLAFDDAENLSDARTTDPDKRSLLLAGSRKGSAVAVKEKHGHGEWHTRYVSTFCPRAFSAIRLPDPVLASRTIVLPLIRTGDRGRANADPADFALWPHDRRQLIDDLWALGLSRLAELRRYEALVNERATLTGRNLEPWRAVLAVALWLQDGGVAGLFDRLQALSIAYQAERSQLEAEDLTAIVVRALGRYAAGAIEAAGWQDENAAFSFSTSAVTEAAMAIIEEMEPENDAGSISARRVGRVLSKMRLERQRSAQRKGYRMTVGELLGWLRAYGLPLPEEATADGAPSRPWPPGAKTPGQESAQGGMRAGDDCRPRR